MDIQNICDKFIICSDELNSIKETEITKLDAMLEMLEVMQEKVNKQKVKIEEVKRNYANFTWKEFIGKQIKENLNELNIDFVKQYSSNPFQISIIGKDKATQCYVIARFEANLRDNKMILMYFTGKVKDDFQKGTLGESLGMNMEMKPITELTESNVYEVFKPLTESEIKIYGLEVITIDK